MKKEIWKEVEGTHGEWLVSNTGKFKSLKRGGHLLKLCKMTKGYLGASYYYKGASRSIKIHRAVAKAFLPNPEGKSQVNHIDGDKANNCVSNLEWCTCKENIHHGIKSGLLPQLKSQPFEGVHLKTGETVRYRTSLEAKIDGFDPACMHKVARGLEGRKQHKGYVWRYI